MGYIRYIHAQSLRLCHAAQSLPSFLEVVKGSHFQKAYALFESGALCRYRLSLLISSSDVSCVLAPFFLVRYTAFNRLVRLILDW